MKKKARYEGALWAGALILILAYLFSMWYCGRDPLAHSNYDSYTRIALAWRAGNVWLPEDCPWLELAVYEGHYYVSFPSVPALVLFPLTFLFDLKTPNTLLIALYLLFTYFAAYGLARRWRGPAFAMCAALTLTLGSNLFCCAMDGGVWYQAQVLSMLLVTLFAYGITSDAPSGWAIGLFCLALSVGCRPFQAVYVPLGLYLLWKKVSVKGAAGKSLARVIPYLIAPALVAVLLGWYNWYRFGNPLEFGHNYLPEFTRDPETPQFALKYIAGNIQNLLRLPHFEDGKLTFDKFNGCAFWLLNPLFVSGLFAGIRKLIRRELDIADGLTVIALIAEGLLLCMHKTLGGYQFGARYLCDLLPAVLLFSLRGKGKRDPAWEVPVCAFACAVNVYGAVWFWTL